MTAPVSTDGPSLEQITEAVARTLATATGQPVTTTVTPGPGLSGSVDIGLTIGGALYEIVVTIPTGGSGVYDFQFNMTPSGKTQSSTIAEFKFKDSTDWSVTANLPQGVTFGPLTKLAVTLTDGNPS